MLARLKCILPFPLLLKADEQLALHEYEDGPYRITVRRPEQSGRPQGIGALSEPTIDGAKAIYADVLIIDFRAETFDRRPDAPQDPPDALLQRAMDRFLLRYRYVSRAYWINSVELTSSARKLSYLNDDETLPGGKGTIKARSSGVSRAQTAIIAAVVWDEVHGLPNDFQTPVWNTLWLDAQAALPHIGTSIVLAAAALEVLIGQTTQRLAARSSIPPGLWKWLYSRTPHEKQPSVAEEFDVLLKALTGHSLKENAKLWEAFTQLKKARNDYVHEGVPQIGGKPISIADARRLVIAAGEIISWLRARVPEDLRWPEFEHRFELSGHIDLKPPD